MATRRCGQCKKPKPESSFKPTKTGPGRNCADCRRANQKKHVRAYYRSLSPDKRFELATRKRVVDYGVRSEPYQRSEVMAAWDHRCIYCNAPATHLEHLTPLSRGGDDVRANVAAACSDCNLSKGDSTLYEWCRDDPNIVEIDPGPPF